MTPAIALRKTEYADIYEVKRLLLDTRFQGHMTSPTMAHKYPPRLIFYNASEYFLTQVMKRVFYDKAWK